MSSLYVGDSWSYTGKVTLTQIDGTETYPVGWGIKSSIYDKKSKVIADFDCDWVDETTGSFYHRLLDTSSIKAGWYKFTITLISPNNEQITADPSDIVLLDIGTS